MRQITVTAPHGSAIQVANVAFAVGIDEASVAEKRILATDGSESIKDSIEVDVGTHLAKVFIDRLTTASFFNRDEYSIAVRQPRSLIGKEQIRTLTRPLVEPSTDLFEELWQFSQVTYGFVGRVLLGGGLLAYGLVEYQLLSIIAGLLFIPVLPLILSIGFGLWTKQWQLAAQGVFSLGVAVLLLSTSGVIVGSITSPPVQYTEFNSLGSGFLISCAVGVAAGLATADDVGRREMIGLAATAQIAITPAWLGLCLVHGFPPMTGPSTRLQSLLLNVTAIVIASLMTYASIRIKGSSLECFKHTQGNKQLTSGLS